MILLPQLPCFGITVIRHHTWPQIAYYLQRNPRAFFTFNSPILELSHSCKTSWTSESEWGSCEKEPAKGQVRNTLKSLLTLNCACCPLRWGCLLLKSCVAVTRGCPDQESNLCHPMQKLFFGIAKRDIIKCWDLHLKGISNLTDVTHCMAIDGRGFLGWDNARL